MYDDYSRYIHLTGKRNTHTHTHTHSATNPYDEVDFELVKPKWGMPRPYGESVALYTCLFYYFHSYGNNENDTENDMII